MAQYARYRAPAENGKKLIAPPWDEVPLLVEANRRWRERADLKIAGQSLSEFATAALRELLARANAYVASYYPPFGVSGDEGAVERPLILTGHQPEMVHPGVWVKNFAAAALAGELGGTALNLVIDADACRSTAIRVPSGTNESPQFASVEFDAPGPILPWEERGIRDAASWRSFSQRVREATAALLSDRMLDSWWPSAIERAQSTDRIGASLAQARHLVELQLGAKSLELPQSNMCRTNAFRQFACHILGELPRFVDAYNGVLTDYRRAHHIRNHAHPVSNLQRRGEWLQAPFWCWTIEEPHRRNVFLRADGGRFMVTDFHSFERSLPLGAEADSPDAVTELAQWEADGLKLRSRALITTMFARLALADLFIHGIGGAKYDEVTDAICERFFHAAPPRYATISGTLRLPVTQSAGGNANTSELRQALRQLDFHPEKVVTFSELRDDQGAAASQIVDDKLRWIKTPKTPANAAARHEAITCANSALQPFVASRRERLEQELAAAVARQRANRVLNSREYAFCLFPRDHLQHFLLDFSPEAL